MQLLPHLDLHGEATLHAILNAPDTIVIDPFSLETVDGWVPDIGLSPHPQRNLWRPAHFGAAGLPATIRHRFWDSVDERIDHTGVRYLGVVLYTQPGQPNGLAFRLSAEELGWIEPQRLDNRRHLLVLDRPIRFAGGMEVLQIATTSPAAYRLEALVLLQLHFVTSAPATVRLQAQTAASAEQRLINIETPVTLHAIDLPDLPLDERWQVTIHATALTGEVATASADLAPALGPCPLADHPS
jgi:hypothetical protein